MMGRKDITFHMDIERGNKAEYETDNKKVFGSFYLFPTLYFS